MELKNITFHGLITAQGKSKVEIIKRATELNLPDENAFRLVEKARQSFNKDSGISYAKFSHGWLPTSLNDFESRKIDFQSLSLVGLNDLHARLAREPLSTGGHLFFIRYEESSLDYLLILLLKDIDGYVIDKLEITEGHILNLDKLHFGARINISKWKSDNGEDSYISFLKGATRSEISAYFKNFLCIRDDSFNDPSDNTKKLVAAIKDYCRERYPDESENLQARSRTKKEIDRLISNKEKITLDRIKSLLDPENPQGFIDFANSNGYEIQSEFLGDKRRTKNLLRFSGRSKDISISFESEAIEDGRIIYNKDDHQLIIKDIPSDLLRDLEGKK